PDCYRGSVTKPQSTARSGPHEADDKVCGIGCTSRYHRGGRARGDRASDCPERPAADASALTAFVGPAGIGLARGRLRTMSLLKRKSLLFSRTRHFPRQLSVRAL